MNALERRSRRLLLAYPADYRADRGEEMLGTLLRPRRLAGPGHGGERSCRWFLAGCACGPP